MNSSAKASFRQVLQRFAAAWLVFALALAPVVASANPILLPAGSMQTWGQSADVGVSPDNATNVDAVEVLHHVHCPCNAFIARDLTSATAEQPYETLTFTRTRDDLLTHVAFDALFRPPRA